MSQYKRSQVDTCLWNILRADSAEQDAPVTFRARVKKLLDLDRQMYQQKLENEGRAALAFNDELAGGQGWDVPFAEFHVFMLGVALEMWNAGFKQAEIVDYLQRFRRPIKTKYEWVRKTGATVGAMYSPASGKPVVLDTNGPDLDEEPSARVYMIIDRIELPEAIAATTRKPSFSPAFSEGAGELAEMFAHRHLSQRAALLIEIADLIARIRLLLPECPARRRGPSSR
jgi:hypothetical protein